MGLKSPGLKCPSTELFYESDVKHCTSLIKLDLYDPLVLLVDSNDGGRMGIKFRLGEGMVVEALAPKLSQELLVCTEMYFCTPFCWKASAMEILTILIIFQTITLRLRLENVFLIG